MLASRTPRGLLVMIGPLPSAARVAAHATPRAEEVLARADEACSVGQEIATTWGEFAGAATDGTRAGRRLIVLGGGPSGNDAAIRAVQQGWEEVVILDRFGPDPLRHTLFNLAPSVVDSQAALAGGGDDLLRRWSPIRVRFKDDSAHGGVRVDNEGVRLEPDAARPTNAASLRAGFDGVDRRPWARVSIQGTEATQREYIHRVLNDGRADGPVRMLFSSPAMSVENRGRQGIRVLATDEHGMRQALDGAFMVSATGGRNPMGIRSVLFPEQAHFVGGLTTATTPDRVLHPRMVRRGSELSRDTRDCNPGQRPYASVGLPWDGTHGLLWAGIERDAKTYTPDQLREVLLDRMARTNHGGELLEGDDALLKVNVQLGMVADSQPIVGRRYLLAGDEILRPYFPTSTGGSHALGVNGPLIGDTLGEIRTALDRGNGRAVREALEHYDRTARAEARVVEELGRKEMLQDLGREVPDFDDSWRAAQRAARRAGVGDAAP